MLTTSPAVADFKVREWRPFQKNTLQAFVSFELPSGMVLHGCTIHERNGSRWIGLPAREYQKADYEKSWVPIIEFTTKESREKFQAAALAAVDRHLAAEEPL